MVLVIDYWGKSVEFIKRKVEQKRTENNSPLSPLPKDHTVHPSLEIHIVWALPHATWPTLLTSLTKVGTFLLLLSPQPLKKQPMLRCQNKTALC